MYPAEYERMVVGELSEASVTLVREAFERYRGVR